MEVEPEHRRMGELRLTGDREIKLRRERIGRAASSFRQFLHQINTRAEEARENRENLGKLKDCLRELEDDLARILTVKACKEANCTATAESISATKARTEGLKKIVQDRRAKKDAYEATVSRQLLALEALNEESNQDIADRENLDQAILWYSRVLGFRIEGGDGVKFIFSKVDFKNSDAEYSFTLRLEADVYTLLHCEPYLQDTKELVKELNQNNGLFKFVRVMREKFQSAALNGVLPGTSAVQPDSFTISTSSPSISADSRCESLTKKHVSEIQSRGVGNPPKKVNRNRINLPATPSPQSVSALRRRSPRFQVDSIPK